jgi:hypothetical protein
MLGQIKKQQTRQNHTIKSDKLIKVKLKIKPIN